MVPGRGTSCATKQSRSEAKSPRHPRYQTYRGQVGSTPPFVSKPPSQNSIDNSTQSATKLRVQQKVSEGCCESGAVPPPTYSPDYCSNHSSHMQGRVNYSCDTRSFTVTRQLESTRTDRSLGCPASPCSLWLSCSGMTWASAQAYKETRPQQASCCH